MISKTYLDCWFLTGATASGKTLISQYLAEYLNAEIVALDSMTVYRYMDIGTAKPTVEERSHVPHHLIDILDPDQPYSLANYLQDVDRAVTDIRGRGKEPLFVGGTPLYLKALLRGTFLGPAADWEFRHAVQEEVSRIGIEALHVRLEQVDPLTAAKLPPNDQRRIIRALEVYRLTGCPISHWQTQFDEGAEADACRVVVLDWDRTSLQQRIHDRIDQMFAQGFVEEVRDLRERFPQLGRTASQAVGYAEVFAMWDKAVPLEETIAHVKTRTRRFAKRQRTWFRGLSECRFLNDLQDASPQEIAERVVQLAGGCPRRPQS